MKFIVTFVWSLAIGQVVAFLGAKLLGVGDNVLYAAITSAAFAVAVYVLAKIAVLPEKKEAK